ncbi:MAG: flagellar motor switch protein FliM [Lachnospiraceae bacterium]|nr:flagellar motor switch protein FliM [Lachnospiraceae bacterium]
MGDVLSQKEIDDLLKAFSTGELDADEFKETNEVVVKNYDFSRPSKFSKEHLRTLEIIFEHFGRLLSTHFPGYLRVNTQLEVVNSEAIIYAEFTNALSNPVLLGMIDFTPLEGSIIVELSDNIGFAIVDRMLGGSGVPLEKTRNFTEIEITILERIFVMITNQLAEPWGNVANLEPHFTRIETNSQFAQFISPNEMVALITMSIKIGNVEGMMNICIPYAVIEPVIDKLNTKYWYSTLQEKDDTSYKEFIEVAIQKAKIPIRTILGKSIISVNDYINMTKGDIIRLDKKITDELDIYVGNIYKFTGMPGESSDSYAVKISSVIREEQ